MSESDSHAGHAPQLDLLPVSAAGIAGQATHVAVQSGDWFDPATWGGTIPGDGAVVQIPAGIEVAYSDSSDASLFLVRVDGSLTLTAENGIETKMVVDTLLTAPGSALNILAGRATDGTVDIVFAEAEAAVAGFEDTSPGDGVIGRHAWDPEQLSLGLVASGEVTIRGHETAGHLQLVEGPRAGAATLVFDAWAEGADSWAPGDQIVVGATSYLGFAGAGGTFAAQDEIRTIASIEYDGDLMIVHLDTPLDYDHVGATEPESGAELTTSVGNLSRNVTLSSAVADQNGDGLADTGLSLGEAAGALDHYVTERGHVMFMHNDDVTVENSSFFGLGRTDKSRMLDDYVTRDEGAGTSYGHRLYEDNGVTSVYEAGIDVAIRTEAGEITNQRGRYALHIHMAGIGEGSGQDHGEMDAEGGTVGPCARSGDPICHCTAIDEDGDARVDYYLHDLDEDIDLGERVDTDGDGVADAIRLSVAEHAETGCDADTRGARISGNVVWGSPGWGIVQHDSRADLIDNVTYGVTGSAIVSETGNEVGLWQGNATFNTINARPLSGNEDTDDFNDDFGHEGVGYWLAGRAIEAIDNVAVSSARAGFMYSVNGVGQIDVLTGELGALGDIKHGAETVRAEDVPITTFEGNRVIAAREGLRIVTDPLDSVRKFNDAWSVMRDFTAYEIANAGVSITYSSKYIFDDFLLIGTKQEVNDDKSGGFFFKVSVADVTVANSHVEGFDNGVINWFKIGDRQEYRRGYWDPLSPSGNTTTEAHEGQGTAHDIDNPAHNLWNHNLVDVTTANLNSRNALFGKTIEIDNGDGTSDVYAAREIWNTGNDSAADDPAPQRDLSIELLDDSARGGLVALWREDLANAADYQTVLAENIPLAYQDNVYLSQIHYADGSGVRRGNYLDAGDGIADDIWSGTVLEFAKTDSLGRQVFAYGDFAPLDWQSATRSVTTNEKIIFAPEMIDGVLQSEGYYTSPGIEMRFVAIRTVFTDRLTGAYTTKEFLVGLDLAWPVPKGAVNNGIYQTTEASIIADGYVTFAHGAPRAGADPVIPYTLAPRDATLEDLSDADALALVREGETDAGALSDGPDEPPATGAQDPPDSQDPAEMRAGEGGDTADGAWLRAGAPPAEDEEATAEPTQADSIRAGESAPDDTTLTDSADLLVV
ncbi:MAG: hypothetical protein AAGD47_06825 [Pseudomonadota bacterium]